MIRVSLLALLFVLLSPHNLTSGQSLARPPHPGAKNAKPVIDARVRIYRRVPKPKTQRDIYILKPRVRIFVLNSGISMARMRPSIAESLSSMAIS